MCQAVSTVTLLLGLVMLGGCQPAAPKSEQAIPVTAPTPTPTLIPLPPPATNTPTPSPVPAPTLTPTFDAGEAAEILQAGDRNYESGNLAGALNDYSLAVRANPEFAEAYYRRGVAYQALGNLEAALEDFNAALAITPEDSRVLVARADVKRLQKDYEAALVDLAVAEQIDPTYGPLYLVRGRLHAELEELDDALADLEAAVVAMPDRPEGYIARADVYAQTGDLSAALVDLNVALALAPQDLEALVARGELHQRSGRILQAIADFETARANGLASFRLLLDLGRAYLDAGQFENAEEALSVAVTINPEDPAGHYWYGLAAFAAAHYAQAVQSASIVLAYQPQSIEALSLRATANLYRGYLSNALTDFQAAYDLDSSYVEALIGIAEVRIRQGDYPSALQTLNTYLDMAPANAPSRSAAEAAVEALSTTDGESSPPALLAPYPNYPIGH